MKFTCSFFLCYILIKLDQANTYLLPNWVYYYLPDLLCMPILLGLSHYILTKITNRFISFSLPQLIGAVIYVSVVFEIVLPRYSTTYTGDWIDIVMYTMGTVIYYTTSNKPKKHNTTHA